MRNHPMSITMSRTNSNTRKRKLFLQPTAATSPQALLTKLVVLVVSSGCGEVGGTLIAPAIDHAAPMNDDDRKSRGAFLSVRAGRVDSRVQLQLTDGDGEDEEEDEEEAEGKASTVWDDPTQDPSPPEKRCALNIGKYLGEDKLSEEQLAVRKEALATLEPNFFRFDPLPRGQAHMFMSLGPIPEILEDAGEGEKQKARKLLMPLVDKCRARTVLHHKKKCEEKKPDCKFFDLTPKNKCSCSMVVLLVGLILLGLVMSSRPDAGTALQAYFCLSCCGGKKKGAPADTAGAGVGAPAQAAAEQAEEKKEGEEKTEEEKGAEGEEKQDEEKGGDAGAGQEPPMHLADIARDSEPADDDDDEVGWKPQSGTLRSVEDGDEE